MTSCSVTEKKTGVAGTTQPEHREIGQDFNDYWHSGKAEITSYKLTQARYGEIHEGHAALIFVTEQFLSNEQVKADSESKDNIPVLKLNSTKNFQYGHIPIFHYE